MGTQCSLSERLYGTDQAPVEAVPVQLGSLDFLIQGTQLRALRVQGHELLRSIGLVIRDAVWGTHELQAGQGETRHDAHGWQRHQAGTLLGDSSQPLLDWQLDMHVNEQGLTVSTQLCAHQSMVTCRAGLVLLHPLAGVVAAPLTVIHGDGRREHSHFPDLISPAQPLFDIAGLIHEPVPGLKTQWSFDGDVFEMEDQRNWSDASFKTYNRPLAWPCPYVIEAGVPVRQQIRLQLLRESGDLA